MFKFSYENEGHGLGYLKLGLVKDWAFETNAFPNDDIPYQVIFDCDMHDHVNAVEFIAVDSDFSDAAVARLKAHVPDGEYNDKLGYAGKWDDRGGLTIMFDDDTPVASELPLFRQHNEHSGGRVFVKAFLDAQHKIVGLYFDPLNFE